MNDSERKRILITLLVIVALFGAWRLVHAWLSSGPPGDLTAVAASTPRGRRSAKLVTHAVTLDTAALEHQPAVYHGGRDLFRYAPKPEPPPKVATKAAPPPPPAPKEPAKPSPPQIDLSYLGSFGPDDRQIAVFTDGKNIYNAFEGDVLEGKFIVAKIGYESVDISFVGFPDAPPRRLPVGG
ncbi:MAG TPA: hypothetical protein VKA53_09790 [Thermoanaerobaculia bacterium]|nr:hypothetical protein [Thermoanaerobaculia bacterium]